MKKVYLLIGILSFLFFSGCAQKELEVSDSHIIIEDSSLEEWLKLERVNHVKRHDGFILLEAKFKNTSSTNKKVVYKIEWLDRNGFSERTILSQWKIAEVEAKRGFMIRAISPSIRAEGFEIRLQEPTEDDMRRKDSYNYEYQN
ncbi:MAG: hypothetical protein C0626_12370 [Arcobacter sp.]|uniref:DUF1425 domain-containing protein n=1 Tax=uncultured Arcobacter sp. TaxID=165434 RepID=UPI000CC5CD56|nr:DUF1425 domain-containing protein [uncultured Arcobacter sp.]PLY08644.1 MAG: hypothetical protein C0626_12370 [Arcobacter sp.]